MVIASPNVSLTNIWMSAALASLPNFFNACRTASILLGLACPALSLLTLVSAIGTSRWGKNALSSTLPEPPRTPKGGNPSPARRGGTGAAHPAPAAGAGERYVAPPTDGA